ncbi:MAG: iron-sulfur cluster assembly accessory protein [Buchnera aphidicola (Periphyllus aceris)]|nr:iron-sulfur cluster assembly accessory protein [Buchnera aphidicola (Periphyllus aceris)]
MKEYLLKSKKKKLKGIILTKRSFYKILHIIKKKKIYNFRINIKKSGCAGFKYILEYCHKIKNKDIIFNKKNIKLIVSKKKIKLIDGIKIDFIKNNFQKSFKFSHKKIQNTCGCGESFQINTKIL